MIWESVHCGEVEDGWSTWTWVFWSLTMGLGKKPLEEAFPPSEGGKHSRSSAVGPDYSITRSECKPELGHFLSSVTMNLVLSLISLSEPQFPQIGSQANNTLRLLQNPKLKNLKGLSQGKEVTNFKYLHGKLGRYVPSKKKKKKIGRHQGAGYQTWAESGRNREG